MAFSELQIALLGAGVSAVVVVWGYNVWQERKHKKTAEDIFRGGQDDALLGTGAVPPGSPPRTEPTERVEPRLADGDLSAADEVQPMQSYDSGESAQDQPVSAGSAYAEPELLKEPQEPQEPLVLPTPSLPPQWADTLVDCVLRFSAPEPIPAAPVWAVQVAWSAELSKPLHWLARSDADAEWQSVDEHDSGRYRDWAVALQLADRRGAVSDSELGRFMDGVAQVAKQVGASLDLPSRSDMVMRASSLDQFCASVDIQFALHMVEASGGVFVGTKLRGVAEACGMSLADDGRFLARDHRGSVLFSLTNLGQERFDADTLKTMATHGISLSLDVPRLADAAATFDVMLSSARQLAKALGGVLVDAQRAPLAEAVITGIRAKTIELQQRMRDAGIEPGSTRALRLFS